jgi:hypothetical protein
VGDGAGLRGVLVGFRQGGEGTVGGAAGDGESGKAEEQESGLELHGGEEGRCGVIQ